MAAVLWMAAKFSIPQDHKLALPRRLKTLLLHMARRSAQERPSAAEAVKVTRLHPGPGPCPQGRAAACVFLFPGKAGIGWFSCGQWHGAFAAHHPSIPPAAWPESKHRLSSGEPRPCPWALPERSRATPRPPPRPIWFLCAGASRTGSLLSSQVAYDHVYRLVLDKSRAHCWFSDQVAVGPSKRRGRVQAGKGEALGGGPGCSVR